MYVSEARAHVRQFARNALDSTLYSESDIDRAIMLVGTRFVRKTKCLPVLDSKTLIADSAVLDLSSIVGFRPELLLAMYLSTVGTPLKVVDYTELLTHSIEDASTGTPTEVAFERLNVSTSVFTVTIANPAVMTSATVDFPSLTPVEFTTTGTLPTGLVVDTVYWLYRTAASTYNLYDTLVNATAAGATGRVITTVSQSGVHTAMVAPLSTADTQISVILWPTPGTALIAKIRWLQPFTSWSPGSAGAVAILNLPNDTMYELLSYGATAALQHNETQHLFAGEAWKKYLDYEAEMIGRGSLAVRSIARNRRV